MYNVLCGCLVVIKTAEIKYQAYNAATKLDTCIGGLHEKAFIKFSRAEFG